MNTKSPWDMLGMPEVEYHAMMYRVFTRYEEIGQDTYRHSLLEDLNDPSYWTLRMNQLEREREFFNKKAAWSAAEMACVEQIDLELEECEMELDRIYDMVERMEYDCD